MARKQHDAIRLALDQIVLGPFPHRGEGHGLIIEAGQDHERNLGGLGVGLDEGVQAAAVRQAQVQQDQVDLAPVQSLQPRRELGDPIDLEAGVLGFRQHLSDEPGIAGIVLHQEDSGCVAIHLIHLGGNFTTVSQKSSMDLTTVRNCSRSTGLVM